MKRILVILSMVPVLWIFSNNAVNWHYHELACGQVIQHAHPYDRSAEIPADESASEKTGGLPSENHSHNRSELITLFMTSNIVLLVVLILALLFLIIECLSVERFMNTRKLRTCNLYRVPLLRAPPFC